MTCIVAVECTYDAIELLSWWNDQNIHLSTITWRLMSFCIRFLLLWICHSLNEKIRERKSVELILSSSFRCENVPLPNLPITVQLIWISVFNCRFFSTRCQWFMCEHVCVWFDYVFCLSYPLYTPLTMYLKRIFHHC